MTARLTGTIFVASLLAALLPVESQSIPTFADAVDVQEVIVEIQVVDKDGQPVSGLGIGDVSVQLAGQPVEVTSVSPVGGELVPAEGTGGLRDAPSFPPEIATDPLRLVIFVDNLHVSPASRWRLFGQLRDLLRDAMRPGDEIMVASYDRAVNIRQPFTGDLDQVEAALAATEQLSADRLAAGQDERQTMQLIQEVQQNRMAGNFAEPCRGLEGIALQHAEEHFHAIERMIDGIGELVDTLSGFAGRKAMLYVSDGVPLVPGRAPYEYVVELCNGVGMSKGVAGAVDMSSDYTKLDVAKIGLDIHRFDTSDRWRGLAARANRQNVTVYALQASGAGAVGDTGADLPVRLGSLETDVSRYQNRQDSLVLVAEETGGRAILDQNRIAPAFDRMMHDLRNYYRVSFRADDVATGTVQRLDVAVERPGVEVRHRKSLRFKSRHEMVADRLLGALVHGRAENPFGLALRAAAAGPTTRPDRERWRLSVPLSSLQLLPAGAGAKGLFTVFVAVTDPQGRRTPVRQSTVPVTVTAGPSGVFVYDIDMEVRPGPYTVGVAVHDEIGGEASWVVRSSDG